MKGPTRLNCPLCGRPYFANSMTLHDSKESYLRHMIKVHGWKRDEAKQFLIHAGKHVEGTDLEDAIRQYDELHAAGVIL
jgi:uncharacterized C2H2 Zn-finger protein